MPGMREVYRILDVNFNRAREALRVAEDFARFVLDDTGLSEQAKTLRGQLQRVYQAMPSAELLAARDTVGDVGAAITTETERLRPRPLSVAQAACKRLTEALRTLEEYAKLVAPGQAGPLEQLRYRAYTFEQRLLGRAELAGRFDRVRVYLLLTSQMCQGDPLEVVRRAIEGGVDCVQLREKTLAGGAFLALARRLRELTSQTGTLLIINDRPDIAALAGADGVHLGQDDLPVAEARRIVGPGRLVGLSTHTLAQARAACEAGADYIGVGPMFATTTKDAGPLAGPAFLRQVAGEIRLPHLAIGGISLANLGQLVEAVRDLPAPVTLRVALCGAILSAPDPAAAVRAIRGAMGA